MHEIDRVVAPGNAGLIGYDDHQKSKVIEESDRLRHSRNDLEAAQMVDVPHLLVNGPITIYECSGLFHGSSLMNANALIPLTLPGSPSPRPLPQNGGEGRARGAV